MHIRNVLLSSFLIVPLAFADDSQEVKNLKKDMPADVVTIINRTVECNRWVSEEPTNKRREEQINKALQEFGCNTVEQDQAALAKRYINNYEVKARVQKAKEVY